MGPWGVAVIQGVRHRLGSLSSARMSASSSSVGKIILFVFSCLRRESIEKFRSEYKRYLQPAGVGGVSERRRSGAGGGVRLRHLGGPCAAWGLCLAVAGRCWASAHCEFADVAVVRLPAPLSRSGPGHLPLSLTCSAEGLCPRSVLR